MEPRPTQPWHGTVMGLSWDDQHPAVTLSSGCCWLGSHSQGKPRAMVISPKTSGWVWPVPQARSPWPRLLLRAQREHPYLPVRGQAKEGALKHFHNIGN